MHKERPENKSRVRLGQFLPNMVFTILKDKSDKNNPVSVSDITNIIYDLGIISEDGEDKNRTVRRCLQDLVGLSKALYDLTDTGIYARITLGNWNGRIVEISNKKIIVSSITMSHFQMRKEKNYYLCHLWEDYNENTGYHPEYNS